ncbi:MAG TPA: FAD-dependent oxidoreductase [Candidatus Saccharimonadales bacterium]|nr:FAD-dependent oxidoreductase [Candidatus Saccharimonadales bacterium]
MEERYDVIVAGAGIAGALAAAAAAKGGAKVVMLDRNDYSAAGKKTNWGWVCGDAVAKSHTDFITKSIGMTFGEPEIDLKVDGVYALSPDLEHKFIFDGEGYTLDRPKIAKKFVNYAKKNGAEYVTNFEVGGPIIEDNKVTGIYGRDEKHAQVNIKAHVVIDALGVASMLRRKLPVNEYIGKEVSTDDIESTGRYIMNVTLEGTDLRYYDPKNALIHLNQKLAPGGYGWVFPKRNGRINIGLGVEKKSLDIRNEKLGKKDTLHMLIDDYVKWNPLIKSWELDPEDGNGKGYWSVTVRRQQDSLVYPGYMGAGDSMAMPNPISAGGIGPAMVSGIIAGEVAAEAVAKKDTSMDFLWKYNTRYNDVYGNKTAGLEVFRIYLQSLNNDLINYGMAHFITEEEAVELSYGRVPELTLAGTFNKILSGISNINAFRNLLYCVKEMKTLNAHYKTYPKSPKDFPAWKAVVDREMKEVKEKFKPNPV